MTRKLVLCRSDAGDGGWSLHAPGSSDEDIASGKSPPLASGEATWDSTVNDWDRPNAEDYIAAAFEAGRADELKADADVFDAFVRRGINPQS